MPIKLDSNKGITYPSWTSSTRPAVPEAGQTGYNTTLNVLEIYDGTQWNPINLYSLLGTNYAYKYITF